MATRADFGTIIDLAARAMNAGSDLGIFKEDASGAVPSAEAQPALGVDLVAAAELGGGKDPVAIKGTINQNADLAFDLAPEVIDNLKQVYVNLVEELQTIVAGL